MKTSLVPGIKLIGSLSARSWGRWPLLALLSGVVLLTGCAREQAPSPIAKAVQVVVSKPITAKVTDFQDFTGRLEAVYSVDVRARVTGYVNEVPFKEGDAVHEGDLLFQIDPRTYQADLNQAEANFRQADADRNLQDKNAVRAQQMIATKSISREDYDTALAAVIKASATLGSMQAARERAKLYVDYTRVIAPINGRVSRRYVDPGNLVNADNTLLTTIVTEDPIYAYFDVDERTYLDLVGTKGANTNPWLGKLHFPVLMRLANQEDFLQTGTINFVDNRVSATTGTIRMRGSFQNSGGRLKPGLFVRIRLPIGQPYEALLVPDEAVLSDQGKQYLYVINKDTQVGYVPIDVGQALDGLRVVKTPPGKEALSIESLVMINGMQRVRPGAKVEIKLQESPAAPKSPLTDLLTANLRTPSTAPNQGSTSPTPTR